MGCSDPGGEGEALPAEKIPGVFALLIKNSGMTDKIFAAAYMTGILPIKKDGSQSAISDFLEYSTGSSDNMWDLPNTR